ncbi:hypothetical protein FKM82_024258 [Ascaphus truei]
MSVSHLVTLQCQCLVTGVHDGEWMMMRAKLLLSLVGSTLLASAHALVQAMADIPLGANEPEDEGHPGPSSIHLSRLLLRAFMKKLLTVESSRPSCWAMVICRSLEGRWFS